MKFLWFRIPKKWLCFSLCLGILISIQQLFQLMGTIPITDSPYTRWLSVNRDLASTVFFILLPFSASIPAGILLKRDLDIGLLSKIQLTIPTRKILFKYAEFAFIAGAIVIMIPLLLNLLTYFLFLPNVKPDNLLNGNILITNKNTLFVSWYYSHPFLHAISSILFASFGGGLFSVFVMVTSLWIKNPFVAQSTGFVLQIVLLALNAFIPLPSGASYSPANFLCEVSPGSGANLSVSLLVIGLLIIYCVIMLFFGGKRLAP